MGIVAVAVALSRANFWKLCHFSRWSRHFWPGSHARQGWAN